MIGFLRRLFSSGPVEDAWRSQPITPESLITQPVGVDRQIGGVGEIGMGGPNFWTMLLADGAMLDGVCGPIQDLAGGRLRVAPIQDRDGQRLRVYDVEAQVIHTLDADRDLDEGQLREACRRASDTVALNVVRGLRLPQVVDPPERIARLAPSGRRLEARLLLPNDLRGTVEVGGLLANPPYGLWLDGEATNLHVGDLDEVTESPDGLIVLPGRKLNADGRVLDGLWLVWRDGRWSALVGQAYAPLVGGGFRTPYFLSDPASDEDRVSFRLRTFSWGPEGEQPSQPAPSVVELAVNWRATPLILTPKDDRISFRVP